MSTFAEYTKKKKKISAENTTFGDYTNALLGITSDDDIAPVRNTGSRTSSTSGTAGRASAEKRTWFKSGEFEDGYQFGDISKTILGTGSDIGQDLLSGVIGMGEKGVDSIAFIAPYIAQGLYYQNGGAYQSLEQQKLQNEVFNQSKEAAKKFIDKDLYDEKDVANKLLSKVSSAAYMSSISMNGGFATADDWKASREIEDNTLNYLENDMEESSVLGEKSDALVQSAGQLLATAGLQAAGIPWWATTGATSFGGEVENALKQGATMEEAGVSAAITAAADILTEKISSGINFGGGKTADALLTNTLSRNITNKVARNLTKLGVDIVGEGGEEVLASVISNLGTALYKEESIGELLASEEAFDEYLESFIGGAVLGGGSSAIGTIKSETNGVDYVSGLTNTEKAVVDKVYQDAIAEKEASGEQVNKKKLYEDTLTKLEKGYIDTDIIESVIGGETYDTYKSVTDKEAALQEEYDKLKPEYDKLMDTKAMDMSKNDNNRLAELEKRVPELEKQLAEYDTTSNKSQLKSQLDSEVFDIVKDSKLAESFNEQTRRSEVFKADLTKYSAKESEVVKKAMESGILNNTNKAHDFVDLIAKFAADKGISFDFLNNKKLRDSGFAIDGVQVNGFVDTETGNISINIDSKKSLNTVVGHEITHVLEGTELYDTLQKAVEQYARTKGEYDTRIANITKLYEGRKADINKELTADLVGDYLFTDSDFISKLSVEQPSVFKRIFDEIKYMFKVATAGSKEARELEKVKKAFEKAYRENGKTAPTDMKYSITEQFTDEKGNQYNNAVLLDTDFFDGISPRNWGNKLRDMVDKRANSDTVIMPIMDENGNTTLLQFASPKERVRKNGGSEHKVLNELSSTNDNISKLSVVHIDEIVSVSEENIPYYTGENSHQWLDKNGWLHRNANVINAKNGAIYNLTMDIAKTADGRTILYAVDGNIKRVGSVNVNSLIVKGSRQDSNSTSKVAQNGKDVKDIRFSLSETVEETKDLVAIHNLNGTELIKSLELGGLPMPSIAIIKAQQSHDKYGDVSLIFGKETIDPKGSKSNKVYGGDAWTPTYPRIEYKPNSKVEKKISDKYYELADKYGYDAVRPLYNYVSELENMLNRSGGETGMLDELYNNTNMMQLYLQDTGKEPVQPVTKETVTKITEAEVEQNQYLVNALGTDMLSGMEIPSGENPLKYRKAFMEQHEPEIREVYKQFCIDVYGFTEAEASNVLENTKPGDLMKIVRNAYMYTKNNGVTVKTETDYEATREAIRKAASDGYKEWVDGLFKGVEEKSGIRNNEEYYTRSGNPRKWDSLHWENTLENVVNVMKQQNQTGADAMFAAHSIFAVSAKDYRSIEEIKADSERLYNMSEEDYETAKASFQKQFSDIADRIMDKNASNPFTAREDAMENVVDAVRVSKTPEGIYRELKKYPQMTVTQDDIADIVSLVNGIGNMPTGYFEAKPQRAVGFDEVGVFVIPYDSDVKLKQELLNRGYNIAEYDPNVEGDRKRIVNQFEQYMFSLSDVGKNNAPTGNYNVYGKDIALPSSLATEDIAPVREDIVPKTVTDTFEDNIAPLTEEESYIRDEENKRYSLDGMIPEETEEYNDSHAEYAPPEDPLADRDIWTIGKDRSVKAYMYENPEVKPFFQEEAKNMLGELENSIKGERVVNADILYETGGEAGIFGTKRMTSDEIAYLLDNFKYSYADIEKGLKAIIEDHGKENNAISKRIEFMLDERLREGYTYFLTDDKIPPNEEYLAVLTEKEITEYNDEAWNNWLRSLSEDDIKKYFSANDDIAPLPDVAPERVTTDEAPLFEEVGGQVSMVERKQEARNEPGKIAEVLVKEPKPEKKLGIWSKVKNLALDKGMVFEDLSLKTGNRELQARWNSVRYAKNVAQRLMENGNAKVNSLKSIQETIEKKGEEYTKSFYEYMYHKHNIDRMSLETEENRVKREKLAKYFEGYSHEQIEGIASETFKKGTPRDAIIRIRYAQDYLETLEHANKPVFGWDVTADVSRKTVSEIENAHPEFKQYANATYNYLTYLRNEMANNGLITREVANKWAAMYPHYVPIRRTGDVGLNINVPLDTYRTGVNAPIKKATGGNSDILPMFDTIGQRTMQTYTAIAKNRFGVELKNTLGSVVSEKVENTQDANSVDDVIDRVDAQESLLQEGKNGKNPTFTVFENGKRITFEISEEMYDSMRPTSDALSYTNKVAYEVSNFRRNVLTQYNPWFMIKNAIKDAQDVLINSQHAVRTYATVPKAIKEMSTKGKWYTEYLENGGEQNSYFDTETNTFDTKNKTLELLKKITGLNAIAKANDIIERVPRLAEYIASRESGRSIDVSMLDAARVTTNFAAGGDLTKFLNRNGATFLNASVQGAIQQARNIREAKANGLKGWATLAAKFAVAGLPALILNHLIWDDDEEYEELSDYVKQNYYIVGKFADGKFLRIPKGRTIAVIQNAMEQMENAITGNDEVDLKTFLNLFMTNLAPSNPIESNILTPIMDVANNKTWYGEDLVPSRLQDLPEAEQYDESTDSISKWLGETFNVSPYKANYLIDQYSGILGDTFLPMLTPEAESGDDTALGTMFAPVRDMFTADPVMNNQNVSEFYDMKDELAKNANSMNATDEDILKYKYFNSINAELGEMYGEKRKIQNSDIPTSQKYNSLRNIQEQIDELAKEGLENYTDVYVSDTYATVGDVHYYWNVPDEDSEAEPQWKKITDKQLEKQEKVTSALGISPDEYWGKKEEYTYAYEQPGKYVAAKIIGGYEAYKSYTSVLNDFKADKDEYGETISGSAKQKKTDYINSLDIDYGQKIILYRTLYNGEKDRENYNYDIVEYLNSRADISYEDMVTILEELDMKVYPDGTVEW